MIINSQEQKGDLWIYTTDFEPLIKYIENSYYDLFHTYIPVISRRSEVELKVLVNNHNGM